MFCPKCGTELQEQASFCHTCGAAALSSTPSTPVPPTPPTPPPQPVPSPPPVQPPQAVTPAVKKTVKHGYVTAFWMGIVLAMIGVGVNWAMFILDPPPGVNFNNPGNVVGLIITAVFAGPAGLIVLLGAVDLLKHVYRGKVRVRLAFEQLALALTTLVTLAMITAQTIGDNNPIPLIAGGSPQIPVVTSLLDALINFGASNLLTFLVVSLVVGAGTSAILIFLAAMARPKTGRPIWLLVLVLAFAAGFVRMEIVAVLLALTSVVLAGVAWFNPHGVGMTVSKLATSLRLPGLKSRTTGPRTGIAIAISLLLVPALLYGIGDAAANLPTTLQLAGFATMARPLDGTTVTVYQLSAGGKIGPVVGSAVTDQTGYFAIPVSRSTKDHYLITTSGGSYIDEISHNTVAAGPRDSLRTVLSPTDQEAMLTPLTTFAASRALTAAESGAPLSTSVAASFSTVALQYGLPGLNDVVPEVADMPLNQQADTPTYDSRQMGLILAGLDQEANNLGVSDAALTDAVAQDISDGNLDGKDGSTPVSIADGIPLAPDATTAALQDAINQFAASPADQSGDQAIPPQISPQAPTINVPTSGGMYICATTLPAFVDRVSATFTIKECGGNPQFHCRITSGALPAGFSLSDDCSFAYDGRTMLAGSIQVVSAPFTLTMSDSSAPQESLIIPNLRVYVVTPPPVIHVEDPINCPPPSEKLCPATKAAWVESGGVPPFQFDDWEGRTPFGIKLMTWAGDASQNHASLGDINGDRAMIVGTGSKLGDTLLPAPGSYHVRICVTDSVGFASCGNTTINVGNPSPSPSPTEDISTQPNPNVPSDFPTNLPDGTYDMTVCTQYVGCQSLGSLQLSGGDIGSFVSQLEQAGSQAGQMCSSNGITCNFSYSFGAFDGSSFSGTITAQVCTPETGCISVDENFTLTKQ